MLADFFQFTQSNLQDYVDCPRRFELRYILKQKWPAILSEPALDLERQIQRGAQFHQLVHQGLLGLPADQLSEQIEDEQLLKWWENYVTHSPLDGLPENRFPEYSLSAPFAGFRLLAKYDLLAIEPGSLVRILDWKTSLHRPARYKLQERMQTHLYLYLIVEAGIRLNGGVPLNPEQVQMTYWFPEDPEKPEHFNYSTRQYQDDQILLAKLVYEISHHKPGTFFCTANEKLCHFCLYRSLCDRGTYAGLLEEIENEPFDSSDISLNLDFEQIAEIEF